MDDRGVVEAQLERPTRSSVEVLTECHLGLPVVIAVPPLLDDGTPFPTSYWLSCPLAVRRIGRIEAGGGVRAADAMIGNDAGVARAYQSAMNRYRDGRDSLIPSDHEGPRPSGGVGGSKRTVKCLHAHYADHASGNENPIGAWAAPQVEPLNCTVPCTVEVDGQVRRNPEWAEPARSGVL